MRSLLPLLFFIVIYLVASIVAGDFYKVPITVAFMLTAIVAVATSRGRLKKRLQRFTRGAAEPNLLLMIWIFVLAGAFANSAKEMGSISDMVNLTLSVVPSDALLAGIFLASALISLSIGTSVGTIVALTPIAIGMAETMEVSKAMLTAIVVGGSFFGDNLSFISDTTVVATQSQGVKMSDKFRTNIRIALPAALLMVVVYAIMGRSLSVPTNLPDVNFLKVMPYIVVLVAAACGVNVLLVLCLGILLTGGVGMISGDYDIYSWFAAMGNGVSGMGELIIITMLAGGVLEIVRSNGGIRYIMHKILSHVKSQRSAELSIAALVSLVDLCTANNTVAIITVAGIAKDISQRFSLDPKRVASILDTFSCTMQGIIPYGAQLLMAAGLAKCNPVDLMPYLYYPLTLGLFALITILIRRNRPQKAVAVQ
ncbi:MAG: Na+/H+ antiporter NhaC family protein [Prevotella sp.]|nr:Na+/H+ antiporter NhaC family protein [Prevotella sp.]